MSIRVTSDPETDRLLSLRVSSQVPLPPEISLADPRRSAHFFRMATFFDAYGLGEHPMVRLLKDMELETMMSSALSRAQHLDRVAHYSAWLGNSPVRIENLAEEGMAQRPRRGWFPKGGGVADAAGGHGTPPSSP
ncbi:MAG: hypothetical protein E7Z62_02945 [Thermoplasmata archaeon]|nr:hypothetical protein [Thermoplasmata archaeon]MBE6523893.1 hypothetical protein [Thermoplasmata archaeon]